MNNRPSISRDLLAIREAAARYRPPPPPKRIDLSHLDDDEQAELFDKIDELNRRWANPLTGTWDLSTATEADLLEIEAVQKRIAGNSTAEPAQHTPGAPRSGSSNVEPCPDAATAAQNFGEKIS
jgi:hypothetical protein